MAERLTRNNKFSIYNQNNLETMYDKLAEIEDTMEEYDIEDLEQYLLKMRKVDKELRDTIQQLHTIIDSIGYDRDTWKKACVLACDVILRFTDGCPCKADYFYQQAKKDGNDE